MNIPDIVESFLATKASEGKAAGTLRYYQFQLPGFQAFLLGRGYTKLGQVNRQDVRDFFLTCRRDGVHQPTIAARASAVSALLHWAIEEELVGEDVLRKVRFPRAKEPAIVPFSPQEAKALLSVARRGYCGERNYAILLLMLDTGLRAGEVCGARDEWLTRDRVRAFGKGSKWRTAPISPETYRAIDSYRVVRGAAEYLFMGCRGKPLTVFALLQLFRRLGKAANITDARCSPHTMRHTFAVSWLRAGGNVFELQRILGHTRLEMTRRYVALVDEDIQAAHRRHSPVHGLLAG